MENKLKKVEPIYIGVELNNVLRAPDIRVIDNILIDKYFEVLATDRPELVNFKFERMGNKNDDGLICVKVMPASDYPEGCGKNSVEDLLSTEEKAKRRGVLLTYN